MQVEIAPRTGLRLNSPVIAASGTFGYGDEFARGQSLDGLGAIMSKGTTLLPRSGNEPIRMYETTGGMLNAIGLQNIGIDAVIRDKAPIWATSSVPVFVNISGSTTEEYAEVARRLNGISGVSGIELNISCPNVKEGGVAFGTRADLAAEVTSAVRAATDLPIVVKLSPNVTDIVPIAVAVEAVGADAVALINTLYGLAIDVRRRAPTMTVGSGGLSGPGVKPYALHLVYRVAQAVSVPVVGYGGIMTPGDALEFIMAGATAIGIATGLLVNPFSWKGVARGIEAWCAQEDVQNLREIIGIANSGYLGPGR